MPRISFVGILNRDRARQLDLIPCGLQALLPDRPRQSGPVLLQPSQNCLALSSFRSDGWSRPQPRPGETDEQEHNRNRQSGRQAGARGSAAQGRAQACQSGGPRRRPTLCMPIPCRLCSGVSVRFKRFAGKSHDYDALIRFTRASAARKQKPRVRLRHSGRSEDRIETGAKLPRKVAAPVDVLSERIWLC